MSEKNTFIVDFVASEKSSDTWTMVLVEEGDWSGDISTHLYRIQDRLYDCIDATLDGQLEERFPDSKGKNIVIPIDCYDSPEKDISKFFEEFSGSVMSFPDYDNALKNSQFVKTIGFAINFYKTTENSLK